MLQFGVTAADRRPRRPAVSKAAILNLTPATLFEFNLSEEHNLMPHYDRTEGDCRAFGALGYQLEYYRGKSESE